MKQMPLTSKRINDLNKYLWIIILASTVLCIYTYFKSESLPQPKDIKQALYQQPKQDAIDLEPFVKKYHGKKYMIKPRFSYDLHGLVVSYKNLDEAWFNIYYDDDPYNIKDLCVVWGGNLVRDDYTKVDYSSGSWTCYYRWSGRETQFNESELSNNHILPDNEEISYFLRRARTGDQVHFKGYLVDYSIIGGGGGERKSSTVRSDTGNHACEVVYVNKFEILKSGNSAWRFINKLSFGMIILAFIVKIYFFFFY